MPIRQKFATPRAAAGRGAKLSTRSAVNEIRHSTDELLNAFLTARRSQARICSKELHKGNMARAKAVQTMMDGFRQVREETSREMTAELGRYMKALHESVVEARQDVDAQLRQMAAKRRRFAAVQAQFLARTRERHSSTGNAFMNDLTDARENATQEVQDELKRFAETLRNDVGMFRQNLREELGTDQRHPRKDFASKSSASTERKATGSPKSAKGAKSAAMAKGKAAPVAKASAKSAKAKLHAIKTAK